MLGPRRCSCGVWRGGGPCLRGVAQREAAADTAPNGPPRPLSPFAPLDTAQMREWVNEQIAQEVQRLREQATRCIPVPTLNMGIVRVRERDCAPNAAAAATSFAGCLWGTHAVDGCSSSGIGRGGGHRTQRHLGVEPVACGTASRIRLGALAPLAPVPPSPVSCRAGGLVHCEPNRVRHNV